MLNTWTACTMEPNGWLRWIECHPGLAGYVQAAGVTVTVMIALLGPPLARWVQGIRERRARNAATVALARSLLSYVNALLDGFNGRLETIGTYSEPEGADLNLFLNNMSIPIPGPLDLKFVYGDVDQARLAFYGEFLHTVMEYNNFLVTKQRDGVRDGGWNALRSEINSLLINLKGQALDASARIRDM